MSCLKDEIADGEAYIVWQDFYSEGWRPTGYKTLKEALLAHKTQGRFIITKRVEFEVEEITDV